MSEGQPLLQEYESRENGLYFPPPSSYKKPDREPASTMELFLLVLAPWCLFSLVLLLFVFSPSDMPVLPWTVTLLLALLAVLSVVHGFAVATVRRRMEVSLGLLGLLALVTAPLVATVIHDLYLAEHSRLTEGASYTNISPDTSAVTRADATALTFASGAFVDVQRTVGYMQEGVVYCVAPVSGKIMSNAPQYWAVGINCCDARGNYHCGDVNGGHSGVVVTTDSQDADSLDEYRTAVRMATSVYSLDISTGNMCINWTQDADELIASLFANAMYTMSFAILLDLLVSTILGFFVRTAMNRQLSTRSKMAATD